MRVKQIKDKFIKFFYGYCKISAHHIYSKDNKEIFDLNLLICKFRKCYLCTGIDPIFIDDVIKKVNFNNAFLTIEFNSQKYTLNRHQQKSLLTEIKKIKVE